jgi:outer membrane protein assembly factor BamD
MKYIKVLLAGFVLMLAIMSCSKYSKILKSKDPEYKLKMADEYYNAKKYKNAQALYEELFPMFKGSSKFEDLYYKSCYCYYYQKLYHDAENYFKGFLEVFPNSPRAEEVDYMHALCFYKQSPKLELEQVNTNKAMNMMQTFINTHPGSKNIPEATSIIDKCREKLELKEHRAAVLYYDLGQYRAAAIAFAILINNYPESVRGEDYKLMVVKSYFKYAKMSIAEKQIERFEKVVTEYQDFADRYPESKLLRDAEIYSKLSVNNIKVIKNEQTPSSIGR